MLKLLNSVSTEELENFASKPVIVEEDLADINESMLEPYENLITENDLLADLIEWKNMSRGHNREMQSNNSIM